jgi:hypothetical protein
MQFLPERRASPSRYSVRLPNTRYRLRPRKRSGFARELHVATPVERGGHELERTPLVGRAV